MAFQLEEIYKEHLLGLKNSLILYIHLVFVLSTEILYCKMHVF